MYAGNNALTIFALAAVLGAGCTSIDSQHIVGDDTAVPEGSFPYSLPKTTFVTVFTVTLTDCTAVLLDALQNPPMGVTLSVSTTQVTSADPDERYSIDYQKLSGFFKNTSLSLNTASDSTLLGVNTATSDQSLQIAGAVLQSAAAIAGAVITGGAGVPVRAAAASRQTELSLQYTTPVPVENPPTKVTACNQTAVTALATLKQKQAALAMALSKVKSPAPGATTPALVAPADAAANAALATAVPPTLIGNAGPHATGSYAASLGGAVVGGLGSWALVRLNQPAGRRDQPCHVLCVASTAAIFLLPSVGATIGYNLSRRYAGPVPQH